MSGKRVHQALVVLLLSIVAFSGSISTAQAAPSRSLIDRTDEISGSQIHLVYTLPIGSEDKRWDTNGQIKKWVDQSQDWLFLKANRKLKYDMHQNDLDISFFQSSLSLAQMRTRYSAPRTFDANQQLLPTLMNEFLVQSPIRNYKENPKIYIFIVGESLSDDSCGFAQSYSAMGLIFTGKGCWEGLVDDSISRYGMSWPARAVIHEVFHTVGVEHVCDSRSDLMWGKPECDGALLEGLTELDSDARDYYRGDSAGVDIAQLPIWTDKSEIKSYGQIKATSTYAPTQDKNFVFRIGEEKSRIWWDWERLGSLKAGGYKECTISNGQATISAKVVLGICEFEIPFNWRGGVNATITGKIWTGPYFGEVTEQVKLLNPNNYFAPCTESYCFEGITTEVRSGFCYGVDYKSFTLQQYVDDQWKDIATTGTRRGNVGGGCASTSWELIPVSYKFGKVGQFVYRYVAANLPNSRGFTEPARTTLIFAKDADYPSTADLKVLREAEAKAAAELKAKQEAEAKAAAELKAKQDAEAKAAAELKAKQEAEAKAVAELKAKQEAEAKAAAELKAKQEAEAKAAAELKAKQEAEAKVAAELKAQQEAELKAAAELKAKQEAEAKIAAELKAKQEAEAIAAAELKAKQEAEAKVAASKKTTITCTKGKLIKKVTAVKPQCPAGYKVKR